MYEYSEECILTFFEEPEPVVRRTCGRDWKRKRKRFLETVWL